MKTTTTSKAATAPKARKKYKVRKDKGVKRGPRGPQKRTLEKLGLLGNGIAVKDSAVSAPVATTIGAVPTVARVSQPRMAGKFGDIEIDPRLRIKWSLDGAHMDALFTGEGIRPSTATLLTGLSGAGKTTFCLQLASNLVRQGHVVIFASCEEAGPIVKMKLEDMGFNDLLLSPDCYFCSHHEVEKILGFADEVRVSSNLSGKRGLFLFVDSLQTVERKVVKGDPEVAAAWDFVNWSHTHYTCAFIIGQVTKAGVFAGANQVKHAVDAHIHLGVDKDKKSETHGMRTMLVEKNRLGSSGAYFVYETTRKGIKFLDV